MKIIIIILLFLSPLSVLAITQAPGEVPIYEPLQPAPEGIKPNVEQSVQAGSNEPYWADREQEQSRDNESVQKDSQGKAIQSKASVAEPPSKSLSAGFWVIIGVFVIAVLLVLYRFYRTSKKNV